MKIEHIHHIKCVLLLSIFTLLVRSTKKALAGNMFHDEDSTTPLFVCVDIWSCIHKIIMQRHENKTQFNFNFTSEKYEKYQFHFNLNAWNPVEPSSRDSELHGSLDLTPDRVNADDPIKMALFTLISQNCLTVLSWRLSFMFFLFLTQYDRNYSLGITITGIYINR